MRITTEQPDEDGCTLRRTVATEGFASREFTLLAEVSERRLDHGGLVLGISTIQIHAAITGLRVVGWSDAPSADGGGNGLTAEAIARVESELANVIAHVATVVHAGQLAATLVDAFASRQAKSGP